MLEVSVDLVPFGIEGARKPLEKIYIAQVEVLEGDKRRYEVYIEDPRQRPRPDPYVSINHYREDGALFLTYLAIKHTIRERLKNGHL